jgi:hypothetical protein
MFKTESAGIDLDIKLKYPLRFIDKCDKRKCMFCKKNNNNKHPYKQVKMGDFCGWIYCDDCLTKGYPREAVLDYIENKNIIPFSWIFNSQSFRYPSFYSKMKVERDDDETYDIIEVKEDTSENRRHIHFYLENSIDKEEPIQTATVLSWQTDDLILLNVKPLSNAYMVLEFKSQNKNGIFGYNKARVLLENIIRHNSTFYDELTLCQDLLNDKHIKISFLDLPESIKSSVLICKENIVKSDYET